VGHAGLETFLVLNGAELDSAVDEAERTILDVAAGRLKREAFTEWVRHHVRPIAS
jgi:death-on-curing protein